MLERFFRTSFFNHLFKESKIATWIIIVLVVIQLISFITVKETTPFFLYGMYSEVIPREDSNTRLRLMVNDQHIRKSDLNRFTHELLFASLEYYDQLYVNDFQDPLAGKIDMYFGNTLSSSSIDHLKNELLYDPNDQDAYIAWLARYLKRNLKQDVHAFRLEKDVYRFSGSQIKFDSTQLLIDYTP